MTLPSPNPGQQPPAVSPAALNPTYARALALQAGFSEAGVVALPYPEAERDSSRFTGWIRTGRAATMRYLERVAEDGRFIRARVETPFPWARSAIVCFASYANPAEPMSIDETREPPDSLTGCLETADRSHGGPEEEHADSPVLSSKELRARNAWVARYAWSSRVDRDGARVPSDYHKVLLKRLRALESRLHAEFGAFESRAYVDTGPVVERSLAVAAGLGWTGKNTCLIHPKLGSFGFLAVLLTSLEIGKSAGQRVSEPAGRSRGLQALESASQNVGPSGPGRLIANFKNRHEVSGHDFSRVAEATTKEARALAPALTLPHPDRCGSCTRCIQACPTHALDTPYQMDASRCIAYLTIEHKDAIAEELMTGIGRQVFGCDICQDVCPWNRKSRRDGPIIIDPDFAPRPELINPTLDWLSSLDEQSFERHFNGSPVRRTGFNGLRRNVAIAIGNSGLLSFAPQLAAWAEAADEGLRHAARWALGRLRPSAEETILKE